MRGNEMGKKFFLQLHDRVHVHELKFWTFMMIKNKYRSSISFISERSAS